MKKELSFSQNLVWNSIGSFVYIICQWLLTFVVVRISTDYTNAGNLALAISITNIFFNLACFNVRPYLVSDINEKYSSNEYSGFRVITCILSIIMCFIYISFFSYSLTQIFCVMFYMIFKIGEAYVDLLHGFEQRNSRMDIGAISLIMRGIFSVASFTIVLKLTNQINLSIVAMVVVTFIIILIFDIPQVRKYANVKPVIKKKIIYRIFIEFLPLVIGSVLNTISATLPRQYLENILGTDALGIYATVATPAVIVQVAASYIFNPMQILFAKYHNNNQKKEFKLLLFKTSVILILIAFVSVVGAMLFGEWGLVFLFGERIRVYSFLLVPVIIFSSLNAYVWFLMNVLIVLRELKSIMYFNITGIIICLLFAKPLINNFGMNGVSYTLILFTIILVVEMFIMLCVSSKKKFM